MTSWHSGREPTLFLQWVSSQASFRTASQQTSRCQLNFTVRTTTAVCHILQRADLPFGCRWAARWRTSNAVLRWHSPTVGDLEKCEMLRDVACHIVAHGYICCIPVFEHFTGDKTTFQNSIFSFLMLSDSVHNSILRYLLKAFSFLYAILRICCIHK